MYHQSQFLNRILHFLLKIFQWLNLNITLFFVPVFSISQISMLNFNSQVFYQYENLFLSINDISFDNGESNSLTSPANRFISSFIW